MIDIDCDFYIEDEAKFETNKADLIGFTGETIAGVNADLKRSTEYAEFASWFKDDAWDRAKAASIAKDAKAILMDAYKGPDSFGIGLKWFVWNT